MVLMLVENDRVEQKEVQLEKGGRRQLQVVGLGRESEEAALRSDLLVKT